MMAESQKSLQNLKTVYEELQRYSIWQFRISIWAEKVLGWVKKMRVILVELAL
jgi:hypothetical protein